MIVLAMPLIVSANPIDQNKALQIASQFITDVSTRTASGQHRAPVVHQLTYKNVGFDNLFTFFDDANGGFVVVAGDDRIGRPVLAYSETDIINPNALPEVMQVMLQSYEEQIANLSPNYVETADEETPERELVYPLITTMWHQNLPFCYTTPYDNNAQQNTAVGCVALTLAQLMHYYKYPTGTTMTIPAYTTYSGYNMPALPPTTFDYSKMHNNYEYIYSREDVDATDPAIIEVNKLLMYAGCALKMNYATGGSSSVFDNDTIAKYFGYDKGARRLYAGNYPHAIWEEMVYNELKAGRPVPYSAGGVGAQNHQFIIDGYDGKGLFHANVGEIGRGSDNQYYLLGVLDVYRDQFSQVRFSGYNIYQSGIFGFQPDKGNDAVPVVSVDYGDYALAKTDFTRTSTSVDFKGIVLKGTMTRYDNNGLSMDYGWGLYQDGLLKKVLYSATTTNKTIQLNKSFNMGANLATGTGTYQIYPIFRNHGAEEWETYLEYEYYDNDGNPMRHYTAKIESKKLHIGVSSTEPNISINKIDYYSAYVGERLAARVYVTNGGTNYENHIFYWIDGTMEAGAGLYIDPGQSGDIILLTAAPSKGNHNVKITTDWEGNNVIYTGKLQITEAPSCQLEATYDVTGLETDDNNKRYIHNKFDIVLNIKNVGTTVFNNKIYANIEAYMNDNGNLVGDEAEGYPTWVWNPVMYLHMEPGETKTISFSIGNEVFRPNDFFYGISVMYYNNHSQTEIFYNDGYFYYVDDSKKKKLGDVDGDGFVTVTDVVMAVTYVSSGRLPSGFTLENADMNGDGQITVTDVIMMINIIVGES